MLESRPERVKKKGPCQERKSPACEQGEGLVDTAVKTAGTGYIQRRQIKAFEDHKAATPERVNADTGTVYERFLLQSRREPVSVHADALVCGDGYVCLQLTAVRFATRMETRTTYEQMIRELEKDDRLVVYHEDLLQSTLLNMRLPPPAVCEDHPGAFPEERVMECYWLEIDPTCTMDYQVGWRRPSTPLL